MTIAKKISFQVRIDGASPRVVASWVLVKKVLKQAGSIARLMAALRT